MSGEVQSPLYARLSSLPARQVWLESLAYIVEHGPTEMVRYAMQSYVGPAVYQCGTYRAQRTIPRGFASRTLRAKNRAIYAARRVGEVSTVAGFSVR
jgi:hypothetical protein